MSFHATPAPLQTTTLKNTNLYKQAQKLFDLWQKYIIARFVMRQRTKW